jgi:hypothetical protein
MPKRANSHRGRHKIADDWKIVGVVCNHVRQGHLKTGILLRGTKAWGEHANRRGRNSAMPEALEKLCSENTGHVR